MSVRQDDGVSQARDATRPAVLLVGDGPTAPSALRSLMATCTVLGVLRAASDGLPDPVRELAAAHGIPVWVLAGTRDLPGAIGRMRPDAVVISSFSRILPQAILVQARFVNVHYSPLPGYRGRANVNWAIINGEDEAAISIHWITPGLDDGNLLFQQRLPVGPAEDARSLYNRLNAVQERELGAAVVRAVAGDAGVPQDPRHATYGCGRVPDDGDIDWNLSSRAIDRLVRGLSPPAPYAFTHLEGRRLDVTRAALAPDPPRYVGRVAGRVVTRSAAEGWVDVLTGDGVIRLFELVPDGGAARPAAEIVRSTRATLGLSRLDLLRRVRTLEERLTALEYVVRLPRQAAE